MAYSDAVERALALAARQHGVDPGLLRSFVAIESGGDPSNATGSYRGLFQLSPQEFARYGGRGDIYDPSANATAGAAKIAAESAAFEQKYGRAPSAGELYMLHQQGVGGATAHWGNPDAPAWQNMASTAEGRQKGEGWARQAIWGNLPQSEKDRFGSVDNVTSKDFTDFWNARVARAGGSGDPDAAVDGADRSDLGAPQAVALASAAPVSSTPATLAGEEDAAAAPLFPGDAGGSASKVDAALRLAGALSPKAAPLQAANIINAPSQLGGGVGQGLKLAEASGLTRGRTFASGGAVEAGDDTGENLPESVETLLAQQQQLIAGRRPAQMFPSGTRELPLPSGMERLIMPRGVYHYNPKIISPDKIKAASLSGRENDILGLGPFSKSDISQLAMRGEAPMTVTERDPKGIEVKAALATHSTAPIQADEIEQQKSPGNTVAVEPLKNVLQDRNEGQGMIDRALRLSGVPVGRAEGGGVDDGDRTFLDQLQDNPHGIGDVPPRHDELTSYTPSRWSDRISDGIASGLETLGVEGRRAAREAAPIGALSNILPPIGAHDGGVDLGEGYQRGNIGQMARGATMVGLSAFPSTSAAARGYAAARSAPETVAQSGPWGPNAAREIEAFRAENPVRYRSDINAPPPAGPERLYSNSELNAIFDNLHKQGADFLTSRDYPAMRFGHANPDGSESPAMTTFHNRRASLEELAKDIRTHGAVNENVPGFMDRANALADKLEGAEAFDRVQRARNLADFRSFNKGTLDYDLRAEAFGQPRTDGSFKGEPHHMEMDDLRRILNNDFDAKSVGYDEAHRRFWQHENKARAEGKPTYHQIDAEDLARSNNEFYRTELGVKNPEGMDPEDLKSLSDNYFKTRFGNLDDLAAKVRDGSGQSSGYDASTIGKQVLRDPRMWAAAAATAGEGWQQGKRKIQDEDSGGMGTTRAVGGRVARALRLALPHKADGGALSDPIDAEFEDVPPATTGDVLAQMRHNRVSDYWGEPGASHLPALPPGPVAELRGLGPGESRDPYSKFDDTPEARIAKGIPDAVMAVNPTAATIGTGLGLAYGALRPDPAIAQEASIVDRLKAMSPAELRAYQKSIGVDPDGILGSTTIGAAKRFEADAKARRDADNAAAAEASRIGAKGQADAAIEAAKIKAAAEADLLKSLGASALAVDEGKRPLAETHPWLARASQAAGLGLGALVPAYLSRGKFKQLAGITETADDARKALAAGNVSEGLAGDAAATAMADKYVSPGFKESAKNAGIGGFLGWEGAVLPYEIDAGRAAPGSKEQHDALSSIVDPWRVVPSVVGGAGFGTTGQKVALRNIGAAEAEANGARAALTRSIAPGFADDVGNATAAAERIAASDARSINASSTVDTARQVAGDAAVQSRAVADAIHQAALEAVRRGLSPGQRRDLVDGLIQRYGGPSEAMTASGELVPVPAQGANSGAAGAVLRPQIAGPSSQSLLPPAKTNTPSNIGGAATNGQGAGPAKVKWDDAVHNGVARDLLIERAHALDDVHPVDIQRTYRERGLPVPDEKAIQTRLDTTRGMVAHAIRERKRAGLPVERSDIADIIRNLPAGVGVDAKGKILNPLLSVGAGAGLSGLDAGGDDAGGFAGGGAVEKAMKIASVSPLAGQPFYVKQEAKSMIKPPHIGPIMGASPGRADHVPMAVPAGAHVVPADVVSALGQGNTHAGMNVLSKMFKTGPYGIPAKPMKLAEGGAVDGGVPIMASDGEFVIDPGMVAEVGGGDPGHGHDVLDRWILNQRAHAIETMKNLAPPAQD